MSRLTKEEKTNKELITELLDLRAGLNFEVIPSGCHIEVRCNNVTTLDYIECTLIDYYRDGKLDFIRGHIRVTYNHFIKN